MTKEGKNKKKKNDQTGNQAITNVGRRPIDLRPYIQTRRHDITSLLLADKWFYAADKRFNAAGSRWTLAQHTTFLLSI